MVYYIVCICSTYVNNYIFLVIVLVWHDYLGADVEWTEHANDQGKISVKKSTEEFKKNVSEE